MDGTAENSHPPEQKPQKKKRTAAAYARAFFLKVAATALIAMIVLHFVAGIYVCHDNAAYPMIKDGDLCMTYRLGELQQGDPVVYRTEDGVRFGRIIAFGGDSVEIFEDSISVNGYRVYEHTVYPTATEGAKIAFPYTVSENCVFVLNDYRQNLSDSRTYGSIPLEDLEGRVVFIMRRRGI